VPVVFERPDPVIGRGDDHPLAVDAAAVLGRSGTGALQQPRPAGRDVAVDEFLDLEGQPPVVAVVVLLVQPLTGLGEQLIDPDIPGR